jgi:hypothetical protein
MSEEIGHNRAHLTLAAQMKAAKIKIPPTCGMPIEIDNKKRHKRDIGKYGLSRSDPEKIYGLLKRR